MKITPTDKRILFDFLSNFEIQNSEWGKDFLNRIKIVKIIFFIIINVIHIKSPHYYKYYNLEL